VPEREPVIRITHGPTPAPTKACSVQPGREDREVDPELGELDRRVAVLVLEGTPRAPRLGEPPLGVPHEDDEPAFGDGREPRSEVLKPRFAH
jgi:hypothetical protein